MYFFKKILFLIKRNKEKDTNIELENLILTFLPRKADILIIGGIT